MHISIDEGVDRAPLRAAEAACECFQIFSRSPHGGPARSLGETEAEAFRENMKEAKIKDCFIHSPYYINFASDNNRIYYGSVGAIRSELETADLLGARGVVTHLGSAKDLGADGAKRKLVEGLVKVFETAPAQKIKEAEKKEYRRFKAKLLLEITAGSGNIMGDTFEEIAYFIKEAEKILGKDTLGVCFDTAHAFASGYDLRTPAAVKKIFGDFDRIVGLKRIKLVHLNDSAADLDSHADRHANIGKGRIGKEGITAILAELKEYDLPFVLETPPHGSGKDLELLKEIRKSF
jgi:deoxyribonuclease-4